VLPICSWTLGELRITRTERIPATPTSRCYLICPPYPIFSRRAW
jgi:hypothetical protein